MQNKQYSSLKIFHHKGLLDALFQKKRIAPLYIRLKPTNLCNHHCAYCSYGAGDIENQTKVRNTVQRRDMIPITKMREIINDMGAMGVKAVTLSGGGEPLTYPHITEVIRCLKDRNIDRSLISNGQLLKGEIAQLFYDAKWVRISFDSPYESDYVRMRNVSPASFQEVCKNIKDFAQYKNEKCTLGINFVVNKMNYQSVYDAAKFVKELGVDNIKFAAVVDNASGYHLPIKDMVIEQISKAQQNLQSEKFSIINNYANDWMDKNFTAQSFLRCYTCEFVTVIAADCKVYFCHTRAYDSNAVVGTLDQQSFQQMWFSEETTHKLRNLQPHIECRNFCAYEDRNRLIESYFSVDENHINFI